MIVTFRFRDGTTARSHALDSSSDYPFDALLSDVLARRLHTTHYVDSADDHGRRLEFRLWKVAAISITL